MTVANPYTWGLGRRKSAVARVRIRPGTGNFLVNGKTVDDYWAWLKRSYGIDPRGELERLIPSHASGTRS